MSLNNFFFTGLWLYVGEGCFGAKDNSNMEVTYNGPSAFVGAVKLVHTSGLVSNGVSQEGSYWGSGDGGNQLGTLITDSQNRIIHPSPRLTIMDNPSGWYSIPDYTTLSPELVFTDFCVPQHLNKGAKLRVWYSEDLKDYTESDNSGQSCTKIFAYLF
jgi:hypothetical protein